MGILNFLKKKKPTVKKIPGPTYLDNLTEIALSNDILKHEWRGKLKTSSGQTKFKIKFYGELHSEYKNLITGTDFAPILVYAIDPDNSQEILIFDGCKYGYDALFCNTYTNEQLNRSANKIYKSVEGGEIFEIIISIYNGVYYDDELSVQADSDGLIELADGSKENLSFVERNAFDTLQIFAINERGETFNIVSEELA